MNRLLLLTALTLGTLTISAQSYDFGLGLRLGTEWGATVQLRMPVIHKNFVLEGLLHSSLQRDEGSLTLLGKQHQNILTRRLNLFYGAGVHAGWTGEKDDDGNTFNGPIGIDGIVGAEATFARVNVSYDFKPAINVTGGSQVLSVHSAVSVRYVLAKRNDIWDKKKERQTRRERKRRKKERERAKSDKKWWQVWKEG